MHRLLPFAQGYVGHDASRQLIIVSFRGTGSSPPNYVTDFSAGLVTAPSLTPGKVLGKNMVA